MPSRQRFPPQIKFIAWNEAAERFSYYGMTSILTAHMVDALYLTKSGAETRFHMFVAAVYFAPLLGAFLADRFLGRYQVVLWLSWGYVAGHATIAAFESIWGLYAGLLLIALGAGGIKPCASAFVGDQFGPGQEHQLARVYGLYYWMINLGSTGSTLAIPWLRAHYGPAVAFGVPGAFMAMALGLWWLGRKHYRLVPPTGPNPHSFLHVVVRALKRLGTGRPGDHWLDVARQAHPAEAVEGAKAVLRIIGVFAPICAFWALFFQYGSSWVLQAKEMSPVVLGFTLVPEQIQSLNAIFVLLLIPIFSRLVYPALERGGREINALWKMQAGMFVSVLSFVCATGLQLALDAGGRPNIAWQVPQYLFISAGEVLVSVTALEFAYTQAPASMKSTIMGLWYLTIGVGSLLTASVASLNVFSGAGYFVFFTALMLGGAVLFRVVARRYRPAAVPLSPAPVAE
jgi:POT family proton-dependent oligopeptide transporter